MYRDNFWQPINSVDDPNANSNDRINNVANTWEVNEKLTTAFVKVGIDTEIGGLPVAGQHRRAGDPGRSDPRSCISRARPDPAEYAGCAR